MLVQTTGMITRAAGSSESEVIRQMRDRTFAYNLSTAALVAGWLLAIAVGCNKRKPASPALVRNDRIEWYLHRATPIGSFFVP